MRFQERLKIGKSGEEEIARLLRDMGYTVEDISNTRYKGRYNPFDLLVYDNLHRYVVDCKVNNIRSGLLKVHHLNYQRWVEYDTEDSKLVMFILMYRYSLPKVFWLPIELIPQFSSSGPYSLQYGDKSPAYLVDPRRCYMLGEGFKETTITQHS